MKLLAVVSGNNVAAPELNSVSKIALRVKDTPNRWTLTDISVTHFHFLEVMSIGYQLEFVSSSGLN